MRLHTRKTFIASLLFIITTFLSVINHVHANESDFGNLEVLSGNWKVDYEKYDNKHNEISVAHYVKNLTIPDKENCHGLNFNSPSYQDIVGIAYCDKKEYFICSGGLSMCKNGLTTEKNNNILRYRSEFNGNRYQITFLEKKIVYDIQKKSCLIPYPHGCLINGHTYQVHAKAAFCALVTGFPWTSATREC